MYLIANSYLDMDNKEDAKAYFQNAAGTGPDERLKRVRLPCNILGCQMI